MQQVGVFITFQLRHVLGFVLTSTYNTDLSLTFFS